MIRLLINGFTDYSIRTAQGKALTIPSAGKSSVRGGNKIKHSHNPIMLPLFFFSFFLKFGLRFHLLPPTLSLPLSITLSLSLSLSFSPSLYRSLTLSLSFSLSLFHSPILLCQFLSICLSLTHSFYISFSLPVTPITMRM